MAARVSSSRNLNTVLNLQYLVAMALPFLGMLLLTVGVVMFLRDYNSQE